MSKNNSNNKVKVLDLKNKPDHIQYEWIELALALQAACSGNQGFARVTLQFSVHKNKPILWDKAGRVRIREDQVELPKAEVKKLSPKRLSDVEMSSTLVAALVVMHD